MWLLIFRLWHEKEKKKKSGDIKQYIHLQKGLKRKQLITIMKIIIKVIIIIMLVLIIVIIIIMITIVMIIIKQKVNSL